MQKKEKLYLEGMYCAECKYVIAMVLQNTTGIIKAEVSYANAYADITYEDSMIDINTIIQEVEKTGYSATVDRKEVLKRQAFSVLLIAILTFLFVKVFHHSMAPTIQEGMSYAFIFLIGLSTSFHCVGMCGGIMLSQTAVPDKQIINNKIKAIYPTAAYNAGRVTAYTLVGALAGAFGSVITIKASVKGNIFIVIGALMAIRALQMMHIIPRFEKTPFTLPQSCALPKNIRDRFVAKPLIIGLLTGLMPCGSLQSMQLYALGTGSLLRGAAVMFVFSAGTVPLMLILGGVSTFASKKFQKRMVRISGILIAAFSILLILKGIKVVAMTM
jgi:uncharacterized protein